ncbi:MAG: FHA domain-containing protein [Anaerolineales bacterium]|nr:FHA domain-containing protein [Anaerolineales bacterium]
MADRRFQLTMRKGPMPGKVYELARAEMTLGRDVKNDLVINDAEVSRQHIKFVEQATGYQIEDLNSTNGTFINGQRLTGAVLLRPGDVIGMGDTVEVEYKLVGDADATMLASNFSLPELPVNEPVHQAAPPTPPSTPAFSIPASTPPAPEASGSGGGLPKWALPVGIGCGVLALCGCSVIALIALLGPQIANSIR